MPSLGDPRVARGALSQALAGEPHLTHVIDTGYGAVGLVLLPVLDRDLFADPARAVALVRAGLRLAAAHGARTVSATGMIPSATDGLRAVPAEGLRLLTGHESVTAAFVMNVHGLCARAGRTVADEDVAFLGLGHIGAAALGLLLHTGPHPRALQLVDVPAKRAVLEQIAVDARQTYGFAGPIEVHTSRRWQAPEAVYRSSLLCSATSVARVLDVGQLRPGTLVVDDSFPLSFASQPARRRIERDQDVMITMAGTLATPSPCGVETRFETQVPLVQRVIELMGRAAASDPHWGTACVHAAAVGPALELPGGLGPATVAASAAHLKALTEAGFGPAPIHFLDWDEAFDDPSSDGLFVMSETAIEGFWAATSSSRPK